MAMPFVGPLARPRISSLPPLNPHNPVGLGVLMPAGGVRHATRLAERRNSWNTVFVFIGRHDCHSSLAPSDIFLERDIKAKVSSSRKRGSHTNMRHVRIDSHESMSATIRRKPLLKTRMPVLWIAALGILCLGTSSGASAHALDHGTYSSFNHGQIILDGDGFSVMNAQLVLGSQLRFENAGRKPLDVRIVSWQGRLAKNLVIAPHGHAAWKPAHYGVFAYFDANTTQFGTVPIKGSDGKRIDQPVARKDSKSFPVPAYGVLAVTNAAGGGIPLSRTSPPQNISGAGGHPDPRNEAPTTPGPWIKVSGSTMTFKPWVLVVKAGQEIHIYNSDSMTHSFYPGDYPVMYEDRDYIRSYRYSFTGFRLKMNGGQRSIVFHHPGIHHIVCLIHAIAWRHSYRAYRKYGGYPYVMDAIIVVEPSGA